MKENRLSADAQKLYKDMAKRLRIERLMNGLTQEELSEIMDVSPRHYGRYESGRYPIPFDKANALIDARIDFHYVVTGERYLDRLFIDGLARMPDEELFELAKELPEACKSLDTTENFKLEDEKDLEAVRHIAKAIISYGRKHHSDPPLSSISIDSLLALDKKEIDGTLSGNKQYEQLKQKS